MTPKDESEFRELVDRILMAQDITNARLLALGVAVDTIAKEINVRWQGGISTSEFVKSEAVRLVGEKLRHLADNEPSYASSLKRLLDEYERS
jgi:hypothetical protein